jgi:hypothetical protein
MGRRVMRAGAYLWAFPVTLPGLGLTALALLTGGRARGVSGVLEARGGLARVGLRYLVPLRGGASAMTLGHVVLGRDEGSLERTRAHERAHVRQCEQWGPLFIPAYVLASMAAAFRGGHYYRDNWFEREAVAAADAADRIRRGRSPRDR